VSQRHNAPTRSRFRRKAQGRLERFAAQNFKIYCIGAARFAPRSVRRRALFAPAADNNRSAATVAQRNRSNARLWRRWRHRSPDPRLKRHAPEQTTPCHVGLGFFRGCRIVAAAPIRVLVVCHSKVG
jgi:hypothetical protein